MIIKLIKKDHVDDHLVSEPFFHLIKTFGFDLDAMQLALCASLGRLNEWYNDEISSCKSMPVGANVGFLRIGLFSSTVNPVFE